MRCTFSLNSTLSGSRYCPNDVLERVASRNTLVSGGTCSRLRAEVSPLPSQDGTSRIPQGVCDESDTIANVGSSGLGESGKRAR